MNLYLEETSYDEKQNMKCLQGCTLFPCLLLGLATNRNLIIIRPTPNINSHLSNKLGPVYQHMVLNKQKHLTINCTPPGGLKLAWFCSPINPDNLVLIVTILTCDFSITSIGKLIRLGRHGKDIS